MEEIKLTLMPLVKMKYDRALRFVTVTKNSNMYILIYKYVKWGDKILVYFSL